MPTLSEVLLSPANLPGVHADVRALIDAEVADKTGPSGLAVKGGYAAVKKVSPSVIDDAVKSLWPKYVTALEPLWNRWAGAGDFGAFLASHADEAADALLGVTDERIAVTSKQSIKKVYSTMRPSAKKNVIAALPRLGALVQKWAG